MKMNNAENSLKAKTDNKNSLKLVNVNVKITG